MMQPTLVTEVSGATIELSMGLYTVRFHPETVLDVEAVQRIERARRAVLPGVEGPVLMVVAVTAVEVDREALEWLGSEEGMAGVPARAVVVPSTIHVVKDRIRWALFRPAVAFRVFRNAQVAKGWVLDAWYDRTVGREIDALDAEDSRFSE
jgi:hypothetical protein